MLSAIGATEARRYRRHRIGFDGILDPFEFCLEVESQTVHHGHEILGCPFEVMDTFRKGAFHLGKPAFDIIDEHFHLVDLRVGFGVNRLDDLLHRFHGGSELADLRFIGQHSSSPALR